jgi:hypothetical protein
LAARLAIVLAPVSGVTLLATVVLMVALHFQSLIGVFGAGAIYAGLLFSGSSGNRVGDSGAF